MRLENIVKLSDLREDHVTHNAVVAIKKYIRDLTTAYMKFKREIEFKNYNISANTLRAELNFVSDRLWFIQMTAIGDRKVMIEFTKLADLIAEISDRIDHGI
jgi:hypothetical protein